VDGNVAGTKGKAWALTIFVIDRGVSISGEGEHTLKWTVRLFPSFLFL